MSKKEIGLIAVMGLTIIVSVVGQWGGTAEMWCGIVFLTGIVFGFLVGTLHPPFWVFKGPGASRTWCLVILYHGVYFAMGYNIARQPASSHFFEMIKGDGLTPYGLAGIVMSVGLLITTYEISRLGRFFRTHWPSIVFVCVVVVLLYSLIRGVLF